jgi:hypothetical protein
LLELHERDGWIQQDSAMSHTARTSVMLQHINPYLYRLSSSGIWRSVVRWVAPHVSEELIASIFWVEEIGSANQRATLKMEAISSSETSGATQRTTRRHISEDDTLRNHRSENLKSYIIIQFCCLLQLHERDCWIHQDSATSKGTPILYPSLFFAVFLKNPCIQTIQEAFYNWKRILKMSSAESGRKILQVSLLTWSGGLMRFQNNGGHFLISAKVHKVRQFNI